MRVAVIGQSQFGAEVYKLLRLSGHDVVGVFTIPDVQGRPDALGWLILFRMAICRPTARTMKD